jgi:hypothetical protein
MRTIEQVNASCGHPIQCVETDEWGLDSCLWCEEIEHYRHQQRVVIESIEQRQTEPSTYGGTLAR